MSACCSRSRETTAWLDCARPLRQTYVPLVAISSRTGVLRAGLGGVRRGAADRSGVASARHDRRGPGRDAFAVDRCGPSAPCARSARARELPADIVRRLLGTVSFGRSLTIHDVGTAASKGLPLGGALGTGLRWSIARDASVPTTAFTSMLVAYGVATTFVTWLLPFTVLLVDMTMRPATSTDVAMLTVCALVVGGSALFWLVVLRSDRITSWLVGLLHRVSDRIARWWPSLSSLLAGHDLGAELIEVRTSLRGVAGRPAGLLARTALAQSIGAVILFVALRGLGVNDELGLIEFARVLRGHVAQFVRSGAGRRRGGRGRSDRCARRCRCRAVDRTGRRADLSTPHLRRPDHTWRDAVRDMAARRPAAPRPCRPANRTARSRDHRRGCGP